MTKVVYPNCARIPAKGFRGEKKTTLRLKLARVRAIYDTVFIELVFEGPRGKGYHSFLCTENGRATFRPCVVIPMNGKGASLSVSLPRLG